MNKYRDYACKDWKGTGVPDKLNQDLIRTRIALCETLEKLYDNAEGDDIDTYKYVCEVYQSMLKGRL